MKGVANEYRCVTHGHWTTVWGWPERRGSRGWGERAREGNADICNSANGKNKEKKKKKIRK